MGRDYFGLLTVPVRCKEIKVGDNRRKSSKGKEDRRSAEASWRSQCGKSGTSWRKRGACSEKGVQKADSDRTEIAQVDDDPEFTKPRKTTNKRVRIDKRIKAEEDLEAENR